MKKIVRLSGYSSAITIICAALASGLCFYRYRTGHRTEFIIVAFFILVLSLLGMFYMPMSLSLKNGILSVNRSLWIKDIPVSQIESVRLCPPTMGTRRIAGSGGFMGYWGWFREGDIGKYFAYYGKASDCFLVTLRNGRRYMLGCNDAPEMVAAIQKELGK